MNNKIIALTVAAVVILGGIFLVMNSNEMASDKGMMEQKEMLPQDGAMQKDSAMMEKDAMMTKDAGVTDAMTEDKMMMKGGYMDYDASKLAFAEKGKVVLFFKADWCPSCKALDADITKNLSQIPADVLILKVNYDTATDLKKKYGVLGQHTLVSVDKDGDAKATWRGSATLPELLSELQ
jgi:thiol-disulfide isomerase/thioredoxin